MSTPVLVVGGAGYIGAHACKALARAGFQPVVYDDLSTGHADFVKWGPLVTGDVRDREGVEKALRQWRPAAVMHFAALALVGESMRDPGRYYDVNVVGTLRLLQAMVACGVRDLVFSSSCAVYGDPGVDRISENLAERPVNPYGATKLACERMMGDFETAQRVRSVRLRYFNAAGADPGGDIGERHDPETHLVPIVIAAALDRSAVPVEIFGSDYPTPDGTAIRDYVHVCDLADAHVAAVRYLQEGGASRTVNLGTGAGASVSEVIAAVESVTGVDVPTRRSHRRAGDPPRLVADPTRAETLLGWRARSTQLRTMVEDACRWHRRAGPAMAVTGPGPRSAADADGQGAGRSAVVRG
ncbi:UDP-glucose 4-epimerase GalE [Microbaculum marinum]|uniref:UDP-glucose 4-epimerase n=1 Tax=Microbaculum marinum TaxID=1764581 RepID=A0AAW9RY63_9HYPH